MKDLCFYVLLLITIPCFAQKEANVWLFGYDTGIDFNYNRATPFKFPAIDQSGAPASICDKKTGKLLFYTDSRTVYNRDLQIMPNGRGLRGGYGTVQASLIVPYPEKASCYYLLTTRSHKDVFSKDKETSRLETGLYYSVVDMKLDGGKGDVTEQKNILLMELSRSSSTLL